MGVVYQDANGMQIRNFLEKYQKELKDKHVIYVVQTNFAEDNMYHRDTRNSPEGVNVKIGKSEGTAHTRLLSYTHMASNYDDRFKQSGVRVLYVQSFPKKEMGVGGAPIVRIFETALKRELRNRNLKIPQRGSEFFRVVPNELFEIIQTLQIEYNPEALRVSERLGISLVRLVKDAETGQMEIIKHEKYDEFMREFYAQRGIDVDAITQKTGLFTIPPKLQTISTQVGLSLNRQQQTYSISGGGTQVQEQQPSSSQAPSENPQPPQPPPQQDAPMSQARGTRRGREDDGAGPSQQQPRNRDQARITGGVRGRIDEHYYDVQPSGSRQRIREPPIAPRGTIRGRIDEHYYDVQPSGSRQSH